MTDNLQSHEIKNISQDQKHAPGQDVPTNNKNFQAPTNPQSYAPHNPQKDLNAPPNFQEKKLSKDDFTGSTGQAPFEGEAGKSTQYDQGLPLPQDVSGRRAEGTSQTSGAQNLQQQGNVGV